MVERIDDKGPIQKPQVPGEGFSRAASETVDLIDEYYTAYLETNTENVLRAPTRQELKTTPGMGSRLTMAKTKATAGKLFTATGFTTWTRQTKHHRAPSSSALGNHRTGRKER